MSKNSSQNEINKILVTVGTTKFDQLIENIDKEEFYKTLDNKKISSLIIQYGKGDYIPSTHLKLDLKYLKVTVTTFLNNFEDVIKSSDVVISHCGAGTILETLKHKRTFIGTVNTKLMDNHQEEIAEALVKDNYIYSVKTDETCNFVCDFVNGKKDKLKEYPDFNYDVIPEVIYDMLEIN